MKKFDFTVKTEKSVDDAAAAISNNTVELGFSVLHIHDVAQTLNAKGFNRPPLKIIEVCNARYASEVLEKDITLALMLPCPITVYEKEGSTWISALLPTMMAELYPDAGLEDVATKVESAIREIVAKSV